MSPTAARSALLALSLAASAATAQAPAAQDEVRRVNAEARAAHEKGDWPAFLAASRQLVELAPRSTRALYNLACAEARSGNTDRAFDRLFAAIDAGFDGADHMRDDSDLDALRNDPRFKQALAKARAREAVDEED